MRMETQMKTGFRDSSGFPFPVCIFHFRTHLDALGS